MRARVRALLGEGSGRALLGVCSSTMVLVLTGVAAAIFYRPYGHDPRAQLAHGHWELRVALASALRWAHLGAAVLLSISVVATAALARAGRSARVTAHPGARAALVVLAAASVATGLATPWSQLLPWSPAIGANMSRPVSLAQQGPFAELVGVNVRYDDAMFSLGGHRFGARATGRLYFAHVLLLPVVTAVGTALLLRRRR